MQLSLSYKENTSKIARIAYSAALYCIFQLFTATAKAIHLKISVLRTRLTAEAAAAVVAAIE